MLSDNQRGAGLMILTMAAFTLNDTCLKALAGHMPLFQILFMRGLLASLAVFAVARAMGLFDLRMSCSDAKWVALRVFGEVTAAYFFLTALFNMPLANATAILQAAPLTVTLAAALFMGMPVGWRRISTIIVGFIGVLLIVRPGTEGFNGYSVFALISVLCVALRDLATRKISGAVPSLTVTFLSASGVMASFGLASMAQDWVLPTGPQISLLLASTFFVVCGYTGSVMVMRVGEISYVAPFRYTGLVWALVLGFLVFGDWPMPLTLIGAGIVVGSGIYMLYRESQVKRAARVLLKMRGKGV